MTDLDRVNLVMVSLARTGTAVYKPFDCPIRDQIRKAAADEGVQVRFRWSPAEGGATVVTLRKVGLGH